MFRIDKDGVVRSALVEARRFTALERGDMPVVNGIVVHQTGGSTAQSTFNSYRNSNIGAHFLIEKDGKIYQTASLYKRANHVGLLRSRCLERHVCAPAELKRLQSATLRTRSTMEYGKAFPDRFPSNRDSIGIELVGEYNRNPDFGKVRGADEFLYVPVTDEQNAALRWLVGELRRTLKVAADEVYRHPKVSYKTPTEAATAAW
ncbi:MULTISPECIES: peptidoglycan recognition protein family protein [unclassified Lysobacter]